MEDEKQKVKDQILYLLKTQGAQTATALAAQLRVSPMAIRQHLQQLKTANWVDYLEERRPMGRPVKLWRLTMQSMEWFPNSHAELMVDLLRGVTAIFGPEGLAQVIAERSQRQIETYQKKLASLPAEWKHQIQGIAQLRTQEGYMAEAIEQADPTTMLLVENHCPICTAARTCHQLCNAELETFKAVLGPTVTIERVEHILQGDRRCAYRISRQPECSLNPGIER